MIRLFKIYLTLAFLLVTTVCMAQKSEQYTKEIFYSIIQEMFPELEVQITRVNTNPIKYL